MSEFLIAPRVKCVFCSQVIESGPLDPCELNVTALIDQPRDCQKEQTFFTHIACLRRASHVSMQSGFYIDQHDFATIGEIEEESLSQHGDERLLH